MDMAGDMLQPEGDDTARISWNIRKLVTKYQETFSVIEKVSVDKGTTEFGDHGVDLITACDIRLCTQDAWFQVKVSSLVRKMDQNEEFLSGSFGLSISTYYQSLCLAGSGHRSRSGPEFEHVNSSHSRVFPDKEAMIAGALEMAGEIAARSPVAVQGTKLNLIYSRDHSVAEGLHYMVETLPFFSPPGKLLVFTL
ncbi:hypothetical protein GOODEAATRI_011529 [Goodea atripinnis]|uniref:Uncharacterized protein n=1 Tax=Goodea atripinnis TaxID=208336 RepID=A0ABV0PX67_9TELE